jgi:hypothetical protein
MKKPTNNPGNLFVVSDLNWEAGRGYERREQARGTGGQVYGTARICGDAFWGEGRD